MAAAAAAVAAAQGRARRLIENGLREQGAVSPEQAAPVPQPNRLRRVALDRLLRQGVVVQGGEDRYWLDEARLAQVEIARRKTAIRVLIVLPLVIAVAIAVGVAAATLASMSGHVH